EASLHLVAFPASQKIQRVLGPRGAPLQPSELRGAKARAELRLVGRLVRALRVVDVELELAPVGIELVRHRRIDPFREHARTREMRRLEDHCVGGYQPTEIDRIASGRSSHRWFLRLRLVEEREGTAARPAAKHDALVSPPLLGMAEVGAEV